MLLSTRAWCLLLLGWLGAFGAEAQAHKPTSGTTRKKPVVPPPPIVLAERPLAQPLHFTRDETFYAAQSLSDPLTQQLDTVKVTFSYVAAGESDDTATYQLWTPAPQRRALGRFRPLDVPHFRVVAVDTFGTVVQYYHIVAQPTTDAGSGQPLYLTQCATRYPKGHPSGPDKYRPHELEVDVTRERELILNLHVAPPTVTIRVPRVEGSHVYR